MSKSNVLNDLFATIVARKGHSPNRSYTAKLFSLGRAKIAQKLGEEATEAVIEAVQGNKKKLAEESADVLYHLLVVWAEVGITPADVWAVLEDRTAYTGIRKPTPKKKPTKKKPAKRN